MGRLTKPKKPIIKKPRLPRKPTEPSEYSLDDDIGEIWADEPSYMLGKEDWHVESEQGLLSIYVNSGTISFAPKSKTYGDDMQVYRNAMEIWEEKAEKVQPGIDKYNAIWAEYNVELLAWKTQVAEDKLMEARQKLIA